MRPTKILGLASSLLLFAGAAKAQTFTPGPNDTYFPGVFRDEFYWDTSNGTYGISTGQVESGSINPFNALANNFTYTDALDWNQFQELNWNSAEGMGQLNNYVRHISGVFVPAVTTNYVFWIESDDDSQLFLSTDATPFNKRLIAQENNWSNTGQWTTSGGGSKLANKRSDQFVPSGSTFPPYAAGFPLKAGTPYWIEGFQHEGGGGENFEVAYTIAGQGAPPTANTDITNDLVHTPIFGYLVHPPTFVNIGGLSNITAFSGRTISFNLSVSTDETPFPLVYSWYGSNQYSGGHFVALQNGDTPYGAPSLSVLPSTNDNGSALYCVINFTNTDPGLLPSISAVYTSSVVTLTVHPDASSVLVTGGLKQEVWLENGTRGTADRGMLEVGVTPGSTGVAGPAGSSLGYVGLPSQVTFAPLGQFPDPGNEPINVVQRLSGFFSPTNTDLYDIYISSDDDTDFYLSTDNTESNKRLIAQEASWSNGYQWLTADGTASTSSQKGSPTWSPDGGTTVPYANGIQLTAGKNYYVEAINHQGNGGWNFTWIAVSHEAVAPTNGTLPSTAMDPSELSFLTSPAIQLAISQQPTDQTAFSGNNATFKAAASTDSELSPVYQWRQNGTNLAGATGASLTLSALDVSYSGYSYQLIASIPGFPLSATSAVAHLTVQQSVTVTNFLKKEFWGLSGSVSRAQVEAGTAGDPDYVAGIPLFFASNAGYVNYSQRVSGYFIPPATTNYVFFIESDDDSDLFISTDNTPAHKYQIAAEVGWSNQGQWNTTASGNSVAQKRSDQFLPAGASVPPYANGIPLVAGQQYYIEGVMHQGGGGERLEVTFATSWENLNLGAPVDGDATRIDPNYSGPDTVANGYVGPAGIQFLAPSVPYVAFTTQPQSVTTNVGSVATFSAAGISPGTTFFQPGVAPNQNIPTQNVVYQWLSNGVPIPGALGQTYTTATVLPSNNGDTYICALGALGYQGGYSNSQPAVLTVPVDHTPPTVVGVSYAIQDQYGNYTVDITYSKTLDGSVTNPANYTVAGQTVNQVNLLGPNLVQLVLSGFPAGNPFTVTVNGVKDLSGNTIAANTHISANVFTALTSQDIDPGVGDPATPGWFVVKSTNSFIIAGGGSDIWGNNDGFRFTYLPPETADANGNAPDFDYAVNVTYITCVDEYSKAGLMIREDLTSYSRQWDIVTEPPNNVPTEPGAPDQGTGTGAIECDQRDTQSGATADWTAALAPYNAGNYPVTYPNQWLRIAKVGQNFYSYQSSDGLNWNLAAADSPTNHGTGTPFTAYYVGIAITAHYNSTSAANLNIVDIQNFQPTATLPHAAAPASLTAALSANGQNLIVSWTPAGGRLLSAPTLAGPWTSLGSANPATVPVTGAAQFFRVSNP